LIHKPRGTLKVPGCQGVSDGFIHHSLGFIPLAGANLQPRNALGFCFAQALAQAISEQMMVAASATFVVQRDQEEIVRFDLPQDLQAGGDPESHVAQRGAKTVQDRRLAQERLDFFRLQ
jgi:hypothetical protein